MSNLNEQHELLSALKDLAIQLGRTPGRDEFVTALRGAATRHQIVKYFGNYAVMLEAAGLEQTRETKKTAITNRVFERDIVSHLEQYRPIVQPPRTPYPKILVAGDMHEPFSHANTKQDFKLFAAKFQPEYIVQVGDAFDMFSHAKFPRSHNVFTPQQEEAAARKNLEEFWRELAEAVPSAKRVMLCGNHDLRPLKRVLESVPSLEHWAQRYFLDLMSFDNVEFVADHREEYLIADIAFIHGFKSGAGVHSDHLMRNTVLGHLHRGNVTFRSYRDQTVWELNAGLMGDPQAKGLTYTPSKTTGWTLGWGAIDEYGPRFIPR